jgi:hypothetical protein
MLKLKRREKMFGEGRLVPLDRNAKLCCAPCSPSLVTGECCAAGFQSVLCRLWVKPGHCMMSAARLLFPRKRKSIRGLAML